jgi:two-component system, sensor histidine kinase LadS
MVRKTRWSGLLFGTRRAFLLLIFWAGLMLTSCRGTDAPADHSAYFLLEDSSLNITGKQAWQLFMEGKFTPQSSHSYNPGFTTSYYWLVARNDTSAREQRQLEIGTAQINEIECYEIRNGTPVKRYTTGDHHVYSSRPEPSLNFNFPLDRNVLYYLFKIDKRNEALQLTFVTYPAAFLNNEAVKSSLIMGILTGIIVLMLIFGVYLTIISQEKVYLFYVLYVSAGWLYVLANQGYAYKYLVPDNPWLYSRSRVIFALLTLAFSLSFLEYYAGKAAYRWMRITMKTLAYVCYFLVLLTFTPGVDLKMNSAGYYFQVLVPVLTVIYIFVILFTLIQKVLNRNRMAIFYLASILPIAGFSALQVSYYSGSVDFSLSYLQQYGQATGFIMEAVILTFGLVYRFNNYRLEKEQLLVSINQQQVKYTKAIITTQESERRQLADQLHDVAGSLLSAAKLNLSSVREKNFITDTEAQTKLNHAEDAVTSISEMLRNLSHAISPVMLDKVGFRQSVEKIGAIFNASGKVKVELEVLGFEAEQPAMHEKYSVLYGILYELINNIIKHAQATHALVQLIEHEESVVMIVEDNGKGLDHEAARVSETHGLAAIQSKIHYLNGIIMFDDAVPQGLIVTIELPKSSDDENYLGR